MPQVVDLDEPDLVVVADPAERAHEVAGLDRPAGSGGEDEVSVGPGRAEHDTVGGLLFGAQFERSGGKVGKRQDPVASVGLDRSEPELAADALELLAHMDHAPVEVDVIPPQAEGLAPAETAEREQDEGRVERVCLAGGQELASFAAVQGRIGVRCHSGSSVLRATLRVTSSSRTARESAELSTVFMTWTLRTESPFSSCWFRNIWTVGDREPGEALAAESGDQVEPHDGLVQRVGGWAPVAADDVLKPVLQVAADGPGCVRHRDAGA